MCANSDKFEFQEFILIGETYLIEIQEIITNN